MSATNSSTSPFFNFDDCPYDYITDIHDGLVTINSIRTQCVQKDNQTKAECASGELFDDLSFKKCDMPTEGFVNTTSTGCIDFQLRNYFTYSTCSGYTLSFESEVNGTSYSCLSTCNTNTDSRNDIVSHASPSTIPTFGITFFTLFFVMLLSFKRNY